MWRSWFLFVLVMMGGPALAAGSPKPLGVRIVFFGDVRPPCGEESEGARAEREARTRMVVEAIKPTHPNLVVVGGDMMCAWADEGPRARDHLRRIKKVIQEAAGDLFPRFRFAQGNHDVDFPTLMRVSLGDEPRWVVRVGNVRVVAAPSDYGWGRGPGAAEDNLKWLRAALAPDRTVAATIFFRHEPFNSYTSRKDARFDDQVEPLVMRSRPALLAFSHEHTYRRVNRMGFISGTGGAPGWDAVGAAGYVGFVQVDTIPSTRQLRVISFEARPHGLGLVRDDFTVPIP